MFLRTVATVVIVLLHAHATDFSYDDQPWDIGECLGNKQSPINIDTVWSNNVTDPDSLEVKAFLDGFVFGREVVVTLRNPSDGHSLRYDFDTEPSNGVVSCAQFHFHFNTSEHTINELYQFGEMHIVCYKTKYGDFSTASTSGVEDAVDVFSFLIESREDAPDNSQFQAIQGHYSQCESQNFQAPCKMNTRLPFPEDTSKYFRYYGSLTTPDCNEAVEWSVFQTTIIISQAQANSILSTWADNLINNNRDIQGTNMGPDNTRAVDFYSSSGRPNIGFILVFTLMHGVKRAVSLM